MVESSLNSIFDLLYKGYEEERAKRIKKSGKVSQYDSENLMFGVIKQLLSKPEFSKYDVLIHYPLRRLIRDFSRLNKQEASYATKSWTHFDFLIYNQVTKVPVLVVEVDGFAFHQEGTQQANRDKMKDSILAKYEFPLIRFKTNESNEMLRLTAKLNELQAVC